MKRIFSFDHTKSGPKREFPADPTPMPPGMVQEAPSYTLLPSFNMPQPSVNDSHLGMRRSFNAVPAASAFPSNVPIYRSFDQGSISSFARSENVLVGNMKAVFT
jgi:hypothetical protein